MRNSPTPTAPRSRQPRLHRRTRYCPRARLRVPSCVSAGKSACSREDLKPGRSLGGGLVISFLGFRVGVEDDEALVAIDDRHPAVLGTVQELAQPHHGRDLQCGRDDRGMTGTATGLGGESRDEQGVDPGRFTRSQVVRQQDRRRGQLVLKRLGELARSSGSRSAPRCRGHRRRGPPGASRRAVPAGRRASRAHRERRARRRPALASMILRASPRKVGSVIIRQWAARMSAYCGPSRVRASASSWLAARCAASSPRSSRSSSAGIASAR